MIIRQLKPHQFETLRRDLQSKAYTAPLDASYTVHMEINGVEYAVKLQPGTRNRMAVLQAARTDRSGNGANCELITGGNILSSLLEILIDQGVG